MRRFGWFGGLIAASAVLFSACSSASASSSGDLLAAVSLMDTVGFHAIDEALRSPSPKIDPQWLGRTKNARIGVAAVAWPKELEPQAKAFIEAAGKFQAALENDDTAGAAVPAKATHEAQHALSADAYNYLAAKAGLTPTKHNDGH